MEINLVDYEVIEPNQVKDIKHEVYRLYKNFEISKVLFTKTGFIVAGDRMVTSPAFDAAGILFYQYLSLEGTGFANGGLSDYSMIGLGYQLSYIRDSLMIHGLIGDTKHYKIGSPIAYSEKSRLQGTIKVLSTSEELVNVTIEDVSPPTPPPPAQGSNVTRIILILLIVMAVLSIVATIIFYNIRNKDPTSEDYEIKDNEDISDQYRSVIDKTNETNSDVSL